VPGSEIAAIKAVWKPASLIPVDETGTLSGAQRMIVKILTVAG
jgi:hypothetical protein